MIECKYCNKGVVQTLYNKWVCINALCPSNNKKRGSTWQEQKESELIEGKLKSR